MSSYLFQHLPELEKFKNDSLTAIVTDIDGTLSKIASTPDKALVSQDMKDQLEKIQHKYKLVAVLSGRSAVNAREMVGVEGVLYIGNHGLEFLKNGEIYVDPEVEQYLFQVKKAAKTIKEHPSCPTDGVLWEDKGVCYSIHYRLCPDPEEAHERILNILKEEGCVEGLKVTEGRKIIEIRPPVGFDKGQIIEKLVDENNLDKVIYLGDDVTDADAFGKLRELNNKGEIKGVGVLIISDEIPPGLKESANFYLNSVDEVLKFFTWINSP
jgi:trehalose 6-phosphate phosphatase